MAIPDTNNTTPLFVTQQPAWEEGVDLEQGAASEIMTSRSGIEQRQQRAIRCRWKMSYRAFLNAAQTKARRKRADAEITSLCWVPFWTERSTTLTTISGNVVTIDREWSNDFFTPGDWVFFDSPTQGQQFRQIDSIGGDTRQLVLAAMGGSIAFTSGTPVYPCRACVREGGLAEFQEASEATIRETLNYTTL